MHDKGTIDTMVHTLYKSKRRRKKLLKAKSLNKYIQTLPVVIVINNICYSNGFK